jgi:hypothetical protein
MNNSGWFPETNSVFIRNGRKIQTLHCFVALAKSVTIHFGQSSDRNALL